MQLQVKVFLFCLSMVLKTGPVATGNTGNTNNNPNNPQPTTPDITVVCSKVNEIEVTPKVDGIYYSCDDLNNLKTCTKKLKLDSKSPTKTFKLTKTQGQSEYYVIQLQIEDVLKNGYNAYTITCKTQKSVVQKAKLEVTEKPGKKIPVNSEVDEDVIMEFPNGQTVALGTPVTMSIKPGTNSAGKLKIDMIHVDKCVAAIKDEDASYKNGMKMYPENAKQLGIKVNQIQGETTLTFEAFRLLAQTNDDLYFRCDLTVCSAGTQCPAKLKIPGPKGVNPVPYEASEGVQSDKVVGVLSVRLPRNVESHEMPNSAEKVCSYTNGFLLTVGAVVLQRQLMQN